jgi:hypothetical protein
MRIGRGSARSGITLTLPLPSRERGKAVASFARVEAALELIAESVETVHWVTEEDTAAYLEYQDCLYSISSIMIPPTLSVFR